MGPLSTVIFLPTICALAIGAASRTMSAGTAKFLGIASSCFVFLVSLGLFFSFHPGQGFQFAERAVWIPSLGISYSVGIDGISLAMVLLTTALTPLALLAGWGGTTANAKGLPVLMLLLETAMLGVFCATDLFLFYVFWEASLIPMYFIIGLWGGLNRIKATLKFFLFTMAGSVLMLVALVTLALLQEPNVGSLTFDLATLAAPHLRLSPQTQILLFWAFFIAFAVKVPVVPVHTWLPAAHTEAPTTGSVILAGVLLKMGGYAMIRFLPALFPDALQAARPVLAALGIAGIVYGALMCLAQSDLKRLIAYSSVSHMGYVVAGFATLNVTGVSGAVIQMVSHGLATGALFAIVGMLYDRTHTRDLAKYGGAARVLPHFAWAFLLVTMASIGLPGTGGFVAEFLVMLGLAQYGTGWAVLAAGGVILGAVYMLTMFRRVMHGPAGEVTGLLTPIQPREGVLLAVFAAGLLALGVYPGPWLDLIRPDVQALLTAAGVG